MNTHDWLWETRWGCAVRKCLQTCAPIVAFLGSLWLIQQTERYFFPVVTQWSLDYIHREDDHFVMGGRLAKDRSCELINTIVVGVPKHPLLPRVTIYQVEPNEFLGSDVPRGSHTWGPWQVHVPQPLIRHKDEIAGIEVVGRHRCHALWIQETTYGFVPIERVPL